MEVHFDIVLYNFRTSVIHLTTINIDTTLAIDLLMEMLNATRGEVGLTW